MSDALNISHEQQAAAAFTEQSAIFDELYSKNTIVNYKRKRVRDHVLKLLKPGSSILELNAGTGEDAIFFASQGFSVHATDISTGMQEMLIRKVAAAKLDSKVSHEICSFVALEGLKKKGPYDHVFSNFAGLNCTGELYKVLQSLPALLKKGGTATLVILPKFCLWETMFALKGKFKTAFRRFFSSKGVTAHIEGQYFSCWYYNPSYVKKYVNADFEIVALEGLCTIVPPSYIEHFAEKHPRIYKYLVGKEDKLKSKWPWRNIGDYYIISIKKKD